MKIKFGILALSLVMLASCSTMTKTARVADVNTTTVSATVADIVPTVEHRITHTLRPSESISRGGMENIRQAVISEALEKYDADVLIEPQYVITKKRKLFRSEIISITVSGRPGCYTNFRSLPDSVWSNPVFRGAGSYRGTLACEGQPEGYALGLAGGLSGKWGSKRTNNADLSSHRGKGFAMYLTPFIGGGEFSCEHANMVSPAFGLFLTLGYQFNPYFYLGAGLGVNATGASDNIGNADHVPLSGAYIPLYGNVRVNFTKKKNTPFLEYKMGYGVGGSNASVGEGQVTSCALGYSWGNFDVAFQVLGHSHDYEYSYTEQHREYNYWTDRYEWKSYTRFEEETISLLQYGISFSFRL